MTQKLKILVLTITRLCLTRSGPMRMAMRWIGALESGWGRDTIIRLPPPHRPILAMTGLTAHHLVRDSRARSAITTATTTYGSVMMTMTVMRKNIFIACKFPVDRTATKEG